MEGDPAVTLKQQVEAIISSGTAAWMSAHTLISPRPSGPPESACVHPPSEELRCGVKLFNSSPASLLRVWRGPFCSTASCYPLLCPNGPSFSPNHSFYQHSAELLSSNGAFVFWAFTMLKVLSSKSLQCLTLLYPSMPRAPLWGTGVPVLVGAEPHRV